LSEPLVKVYEKALAKVKRILSGRRKACPLQWNLTAPIQSTGKILIMNEIQEGTENRQNHSLSD
jgi:hypothetical protein